MKYFTSKELKGAQKDDVTKKLSQLAGKNVRYNLAINAFKKCAERLSLPKTAKILDLGAAAGIFLQQLKDLGYSNLYAHDIDNYLPQEKSGLVQEYKLADLSMEKLPWPDNSFDAVTAWCVLPHLENPFHAAREVRRVLKPDGIFLFTALHLTSKHSLEYFNRHKNFGSYREGNNHIALLPDSVVRKTMLKFFDLLDTDYLVIPKIFNGWRGKIRKLIFNLAGKNPAWQQFLKKRWGYNIAYFLRKKDLADKAN